MRYQPPGEDFRAACAAYHRARLARFERRAWAWVAWAAVIVAGGALTRALGLA